MNVILLQNKSANLGVIVLDKKLNYICSNLLIIQPIKGVVLYKVIVRNNAYTIIATVLFGQFFNKNSSITFIYYKLIIPFVSTKGIFLSFLFFVCWIIVAKQTQHLELMYFPYWLMCLQNNLKD